MDLAEAQALWWRGQAEAACALLRHSEPELAEHRGRWLSTLARWELARGNAAAALEALDLAAGVDAGDPAWGLAASAEVLADLGAFDRAIASAGAVRTSASADAEAGAIAARAEGRVAAARGATDEALHRYDEAVVRLREVEERAGETAATHLDAAEALLERDGPGDGSAAAARLADARDLIEGQGIVALRPRLRLLVAWAQGSAGSLDEAASELSAIEAEARDSGARALAWRAAAVLARLHEQHGAELLARRAWERAVEVLEGLAMSLPPARRETFWSDQRRRAARAKSRARPRPSVPPPGELPILGEGRLGRLLEILKRLASEHDLDRLLERVTDAAVELSGAERGFVLLAETRGFAPRAVRDRAHPSDPHVAFSRSIAEAVLIDGEPLVTVDAASDERLAEYVSVHRLMLKSVACLPIRGPKGPVGVLYLEHRMRRGRFGEEGLDLLLAFADQAAIALENARLMARLSARREELEGANRELEAANARIEDLLHAKTAELEEARRELTRARDALREAHDQHGIVGRSEPMRRLFAVVERVRDADVPVVIQGESGTGKELVARAIHFGGSRARGPFVAINCAAIPEGLLESELFGHVRGAFTGADRDRAGVLDKASGGSLFLDEVGDMPPKMQVDLLRVLQEGRYRPIGSDTERTADVRVLAASNTPLTALIEEGRFREDLYYRLNVVELFLPPLRERPEDIPLLCDHFLARFADRDEQTAKRLSRGALERLVGHPYPGNVRQLEHLLLNAWVMAEGDVIDADDLALTDDGQPVALSPRLERALAEEAHEGEAAPGRAAPPATLEEYKTQERQRILEALERHAWNRVKAARFLGMARRTFYRRLKEYEIL
ncbi:MAG: sigma 54-interacting transcriptional regulator [Sandaracinaceae bacterium]